MRIFANGKDSNRLYGYLRKLKSKADQRDITYLVKPHSAKLWQRRRTERVSGVTAFP